jgi:hypothetical protein
VKNKPVMWFLNSSNVNLEKLNIPESQNPYIYIRGAKSKNFSIRTINTNNQRLFQAGDEVEKTTIRIF